MTNDDNTIEDETGNWLHERLMERFGLETEVWAIERVSAVTTRLNAARYPQRPLIAEILWMQEMSAFIGSAHTSTFLANCCSEPQATTPPRLPSPTKWGTTIFNIPESSAVSSRRCAMFPRGFSPQCTQ